MFEVRLRTEARLPENWGLVPFLRRVCGRLPSIGFFRKSGHFTGRTETFFLTGGSCRRQLATAPFSTGSSLFQLHPFHEPS